MGRERYRTQYARRGLAMASSTIRSRIYNPLAERVLWALVISAPDGMMFDEHRSVTLAWMAWSLEPTSCATRCNIPWLSSRNLPMRLPLLGAPVRKRRRSRLLRPQFHP
jgi:hypothetical protein